MQETPVRTEAERHTGDLSKEQNNKEEYVDLLSDRNSIQISVSLCL